LTRKFYRRLVMETLRALTQLGQDDLLLELFLELDYEAMGFNQT